MVGASKRKKKTVSTIYVDIVSDIICPWCWLGAVYFQKAAAQFNGNVELTWRPYMLDPNVPPEGVPYKAYMKTKFGDTPDNRWQAMREHLETAGPEAGIEFKFKNITLRPNTLNAHRVMKWAQGQEQGSAMAMALFKAAFTDTENIGDPAILSALAGKIGLDADLVTELLASDKDRLNVQNEIRHFRSLGVSGVPTFIYNGQFAIQGAQPIETHLKAMTQAAQNPIIT